MVRGECKQDSVNFGSRHDFLQSKPSRRLSSIRDQSITTDSEQEHQSNVSAAVENTMAFDRRNGIIEFMWH
jgi:hypothetical protein